LTDLITGINGFVGRHLAAAITADGGRAVGLDLPTCNLCNLSQVMDLVRQASPARVYHFAAMSSMGRSWEDRERVFAVNVQGTRNLLTALAEAAPGARILMVSTGAVYGPGSGVIKETDPLSPSNPYAESKVQAEQVCQEFIGRGLDVRIARPLGHTGPGQNKGFVVPDLAAQIAAIKKGRSEPRLRVGNLKVQREFADARDVIRAYRTILKRGEPGGVYNVANNQPHSIEEVARTLLRIAGVEADLTPDPALLRPADESSPRLDTSRLLALGFSYQIPFEKTLADVLAWWMEQ